MMKQNASLVGRTAETRAEGWLVGQGLRTLDRNWRCREGELDLVMMDDDTLCFVEVKLRHCHSMVDAAAAVDFTKQQRLIKAAALWLATHESWADFPCRFDVIAVSSAQTGKSDSPDGNTDGQHQYHWLKDAFHSE